MFLYDRRSRKNVQIFAILSTILITTGFYLYFISLSETTELSNLQESVNDVVEVAQLIEKGETRKLLKKTNDDLKLDAETFYDGKVDQRNGVEQTNQEQQQGKNMREISHILEQNDPRVREYPKFVDTNQGEGDRLTADTFYDEKLKQKQLEDKVSNKENADLLEFTQQRKNTTLENLNMVGKSAAVQNWLAKQKSLDHPLTDVESQFKGDDVQTNNELRNQKMRRSKTNSEMFGNGDDERQ